jgi:hypothetical protein
MFQKNDVCISSVIEGLRNSRELPWQSAGTDRSKEFPLLHNPVLPV